MVILALGRLGGGVLTHASDLDLVYLFTGSFETESDGAKPLGATQYFNRLGQRITNALSVQTAAGPLYEVDTRLRPSGAQGLLAVSLDSFARYQREEAWTRSDERRVGKACVSTCRSRWSTETSKKNNTIRHVHRKCKEK